MRCIHCCIHNPESNKICFQCKKPLVNFSEIQIDTKLNSQYNRFKKIKNLIQRFELIKKSFPKRLSFINQQYQFFKRPWWAAVLSIIPGLGQIYNRQYIKSIPYFIFSLLFLGLFIAFIRESFSNWFIYLFLGIMVLSFMDAFSTSIIKNHYGIITRRQYFSLFFYGLFLLGTSLFLLQWFSHGMFQLVNINNDVLQPYLRSGDRVCINRLVYWFSSPQRGDIVYFRTAQFSAEDSQGNIFIFAPGNYLERIIGLPGETVEFRDKQIYINNQKLPDEYYPLVRKNIPYTLKIQVPSDSYFILQSVIPQPGDSLHDKFWTLLGLPIYHDAVIRDKLNWEKASIIPKKRIIGKPWFIYNPPERRNFL